MRFALITAGAILSGGTWAHAAVINVNPIADTYVSSQNQTTVQNTSVSGVATFVANNGDGTSNLRWAYLRFDIAAALAANSQTFADVTGIKLTLTSTQTSALVENVYGLPAANDTWVETTLTMNNDPNKITDGTSKLVFNTAKAYNTAALATWTARATAGAENAFDVTSGPVFDFINADADKVFTFVVAANRNVGGGGVAWASREASSGAPVLTLTTVPEPGTVGLLGAAAAGLLMRRRPAAAPRA
ncbi:MAG TPA: DNRLRE domain-containing protein [Tepidisphaeraceae bacterium]|nr:DNRLRE domain-containing protein [Tepidisphaeraceae bacterium]